MTPSSAPAGPGGLDRHGSLMDGVYRHTRHVYDLSRKYYLIGRDRMIGELGLQPGETLCEIGCGTGRNLALIARRYPGARLYGVDASSEMLKSAAGKTRRASPPITLVHGFAETVSLEDFGDAPRAGFDVVIFPYALSMIPDWQGAIANAAALLAPAGRLHAVDFGTMERWPGLVRSPFQGFLSKFHVTPRTGVHDALAATNRLTSISETPLAGGYAMLYFGMRTG